MKISIGHQTFSLRFWSTSLFLLILILLLGLGNWQLRRYYSKKQLLQYYEQTIAKKPLSLKQALKKKSPEFHRVRVFGWFVNQKNILLMNQIVNHQPGFDVITPFKPLNHHKAILVNRGWMPRTQRIIPSVLEPMVLTGYLKKPEKKRFFLGETVLNKGYWPLRVQKIELAQLAKATRLKLYPYMIRLSLHAKHGFNRHWKLTMVTPAKHMGYAIQWFLMALVLVIAFGCFVREKE